MEYIRKKRNANYFAPKCKLYLRHDFNHECAYCKIHEQDVSNIQMLAERNFEMDHFLPQAVGDNGIMIHDYSNLFYSCERCNGVKSDEQNLLNPCEDDIFSGETPHINGGGPTENYMYYASTEEGERYIQVFQLNSRYHLNLRKAIQERNEKRLEALKIIRNIEQFDYIDPWIIETLKQLDYTNESGSEEERLFGNSKDGVSFCELKKLLSTSGIKCEFPLEEYNLDAKLFKDDTCYDCEVVFDYSEKIEGDIVKYLIIDTVKNWTLEGHNYGVLYFFPKLQRLFFYRVNLSELDMDKQRIKIKLADEIPLHKS